MVTGLTSPKCQPTATLCLATWLLEQFLSGFFGSSGVPITTLPISLRQSEVGSAEFIFLHVTN